MTAAELHALVQHWPEEAKPKYLVYREHGTIGEGSAWAMDYYASRELDIYTAIALHFASGLEYLIGEGFHSFIFDCGDTDVADPSLTLYDKTVHGKTTIELISAAITATKGNV